MADFIDREELKLQIAKQSQYFGFGYINKIMDIIKEQPSADTERHAHWIQDKDITELTLTCNCCGYSYIEADPNCEERYDFCPHCGCKMDEVVAMTKEKAIKTRKFRAMTIREYCDLKKSNQCEYYYGLFSCEYSMFNESRITSKPYKTKDGKYIFIEVRE